MSDIKIAIVGVSIAALYAIFGIVGLIDWLSIHWCRY